MTQPTASAHRARIDMDVLYGIGLMSGTSVDAVDGALVRLSPPAPTHSAWQIQVLEFASVPMPAHLATELLALNNSGANELHRAALAANALMRLYAQCVQALRHARPNLLVDVIGAHGQTVRHRPAMFDETGYTLQLVNGALLAELTGVPVACDFRSRDLAAGGQGAPLAPAFHQAVWGHLLDTHTALSAHDDKGYTHLSILNNAYEKDTPYVQADSQSAPLAVLNLGGIANISVLHAQGYTLGFDCGPANALLDYWCQSHTGQPYDAAGQWAAQGCVSDPLLQRLLAEPFIHQPLPKSTGRDLFNPDWLHVHLNALPTLEPVDVQATLTAFTAHCVALHMQRYAPIARHLIVCGGGVFNQHVMRLIQQLLPHVTVQSSQHWGIAPQAVEATAFAWLAAHTLLQRPLALQAITGACAPRVPGCLYPA